MLHVPTTKSYRQNTDIMPGDHKKRQYWKHGPPSEADVGDVTGLDGTSYAIYIPARPTDTERFWVEFDHMSIVQLERARGFLGYRPTPKELIQLRRSYGESPTLIAEEGGLGVFHVGGRCPELLAHALTREDKRYEVQGVGIEAYEGSVFLVRPVSLLTQLSCRMKREKQERDRNEKGKGKDGGNGDRGPPTSAQAGPAHDARASAFRTVNSGHWAASTNGPWAFGGAR